MHILTRKYQLCHVHDCNHPHHKIDTTKLLLTSREWALVQIVKYLSLDTFIAIAMKCTNFVLYLQQYSLDPFHIYTSYQATWKGVLHVKLFAKFQNLNFKQSLAATKQLYKWYFPSVCLSVCPSVRLSVCHTFFTMFPSSYHHEIFRSYYHGQEWCPCKRSRSEVKGQGHRGQHPT